MGSDSTYVTLTTDDTSARLSDQASGTSVKFDFAGVRRPLRGIEIREDTPAVLKVIDAAGKHLPLFDAGSRQAKVSDSGVAPEAGRTFCYSNFIIQTAQEMRDEKRQVAETFGDPWVFFFGERPRIINYMGVLLNTLDFNWKQEFWRNYETYLRGTRLAELNAKIYLYYDQQIVEGYMLGAQAQNSDQSPYHLPFGFSLFVTGYTYLAEMQSAASGQYPLGTNVSTYDDPFSESNNPQVYQSTLEAVRRAAQNAQYTGTGISSLVQAVSQGLADAETSIAGFINNVKNTFYGRTLVVPAGASGSEYLAGIKTMANALTATATVTPQKQRGKISDNTDEYLGGDGGSQAARDMLNRTKDLRDTLEDWYALERKCLGQMRASGLQVDDASSTTAAMFSQAGLSGMVTKIGGAVDFAAGTLGVDALMTSGIVPFGTKTNPVSDPDTGSTSVGTSYVPKVKTMPATDRPGGGPPSYKELVKTNFQLDRPSPVSAPAHPGTVTNPIGDELQGPPAPRSSGFTNPSP